MKILIVCLGNICRSPIAEGVLNHKIRRHGLSWEVASAGTNGYHTGEPPHEYSRKVCNRHGIDISSQRARRFTADALDRYDKIFVMASDVHRDVCRIAAGHPGLAKVDYFLNELHPGSNQEVPDPWYGDETGYLPVFEMIERTCEAIIKKYQ